MPKIMTPEQMQNWMMLQMKVYSDKAKYAFFCEEELEFVADKILDELEATEEQPEEGEAEPGACGKNCTCPRCIKELFQGCREIRLKAQIEQLTKERDELKAKVEELTEEHGQLAEGRDFQASMHHKYFEKSRELINERDDLKCKVNEARRQRDYSESERNELRMNLEKLVQGS
jgi:DNA repair exonuclease SbcCD ATPase subunit